MNLKGLIYRELGEGMTEKELASAVRVPPRTLVDILCRTTTTKTRKPRTDVGAVGSHGTHGSPVLSNHLPDLMREDRRFVCCGALSGTCQPRNPLFNHHQAWWN
jgi:hypothetical protein